MDNVQLTALICGGGHGAHALAGIASSLPNVKVKVMSLFADEAERWAKILETEDLLVSATQKDESIKQTRTKPTLVTNDPAKAMEKVDIILFVVPAFAHQQYFDVIEKHIQPNTVIVGLPGQAGFELQALFTLKDKAKPCAILSLETLPWNCRISEFGKSVQILGFKDDMGTSYIEGKGAYKLPPLQMTEYVIGGKPHLIKLQNYLAVNLMAKSIVHPPVMYGRWKDWDGKPLAEKPLFYQGVDDEQVGLLSDISSECIATAKEIQRQRPDYDMSGVGHVFDQWKMFYAGQISDDSSLKMLMKTNKAYDGLVHPMKEVKGGFVPDFGYRYITEDIPFGLVVLKGIAEIAGVKTPTIDKVLEWGQSKLGKVYIEGTSLTGKDVKFSRAPQAFGVTTLAQLCDV